MDFEIEEVKIEEIDEVKIEDMDVIEEAEAPAFGLLCDGWFGM